MLGRERQVYCLLQVQFYGAMASPVQHRLSHQARRFLLLVPVLVQGLRLELVTAVQPASLPMSASRVQLKRGATGSSCQGTGSGESKGAESLVVSPPQVAGYGNISMTKSLLYVGGEASACRWMRVCVLVCFCANVSMSREKREERREKRDGRREECVCVCVCVCVCLFVHRCLYDVLFDFRRWSYLRADACDMSPSESHAFHLADASIENTEGFGMLHSPIVACLNRLPVQGINYVV